MRYNCAHSFFTVFQGAIIIELKDVKKSLKIKFSTRTYKKASHTT